MMIEVERFVDGLKAAGVEFFAGVPVTFPYCSDKGICPKDCINELYQKGLA